MTLKTELSDVLLWRNMNNFDFDNEYRKQGYIYIVGIDEAGRGPLAGPVVAACVILPPSFNDPRINDSKTLKDEELILLSQLIKENALEYQIKEVSPVDIDKLNIYQASKKAMVDALNALTKEYDIVLTDAMPLSLHTLRQESIIKGDAKSLSIAAASILAKVYRDDLMRKLDETYPQYDFKNNKGYPTKSHLEALKTYGPIKGIHRYSYGPVKEVLHEQLTLF